MIACICGGVGEIAIIGGLITAVSCIVCWIKKKLGRHADCKCECHDKQLP